MVVKFAGKPATKPQDKRRGGGSTKPKALDLDLNQPGRVRNAHFQHLLGGMSASAFHTQRRKRLIPPPDGRDPRPYWNTSTIKTFLEKKQ